MMGFNHYNNQHIIHIAVRLVGFVLTFTFFFCQAILGQKPSIKFPDGVEVSTPCGLVAEVGIWKASGNLTGDLSKYFQNIQIRTDISSQCSIDLNSCSATQPNSSTYCYCSGSTGNGTDTVYSLEIANIAKRDSTRAFVRLNPMSVHLDSLTLEIGNLPIIYEEVMAYVEVKAVPGLLMDDDGGNLWMMMVMSYGNLTLNSDTPNTTFVSTSPRVDVRFCVRHLLPGYNVYVDGTSVILDNDCVIYEMANAPSTVSFEYTQNSSCDTGKTFNIRLTTPEPSTTIAPTTTANGCQHVMIYECWIAALATAILFLA